MNYALCFANEFNIYSVINTAVNLEIERKLHIVPSDANPYIWKFANEKDINKAMNMIRCGFELETQSCGGRSYNGFRADELDFWNEDLLTYESDDSVNGPEIQTRGANTYSEFKQALVIFKNDIDIDTRCSFHIHVSLPNIDHSYGRQIQAWIYEYIINHMDEVPTCVLERWKNTNWLKRFFNIMISTYKYSFVAYRPEHKTWEFRCFGNVSNEVDAMKCLELATRAMQYAYKVKYKLLTSEYKKTSDKSSMTASLVKKFNDAFTKKVGEFNHLEFYNDPCYTCQGECDGCEEYDHAEY